jgi:predicted transcriptional regulator with HTH domain
MQADFRNWVDDLDKPLVQELRQRLTKDKIEIGPKRDYDSWIARFVRAKKRNVDAAYKMLVETLEWRAERKGI